MDITENKLSPSRQHKKVKSIKINNSETCSNLNNSFVSNRTDTIQLRISSHFDQEQARQSSSPPVDSDFPKAFVKNKSLFSNQAEQVQTDLRPNNFVRSNRKKTTSGSKSKVGSSIERFSINNSEKLSRIEEKKVNKVLQLIQSGRNLNKDFFRKRNPVTFKPKMLKNAAFGGKLSR